jgi:leucyl-tRNA synthetase
VNTFEKQVSVPILQYRVLSSFWSHLFAPYRRGTLVASWEYEIHFSCEVAEWDESKILTESVSIAVQVNGKVRTVLTVASGTDEKEVTRLALADANDADASRRSDPRKIIFIRERFLSIVV